MDDLALCTFRNLAQATYREARHIGPPGDRRAKFVVPDGHYVAAATRCSSRRGELQGLGQYDASEGAASTADVLAPYRALTGLEPEDLAALFRSDGWQPKYGGERWAAIVETLIKLRSAIDADDEELALTVCEEVQHLEHNSGPLVPSPEQWEADGWVRQKWPRLCR